MLVYQVVSNVHCIAIVDDENIAKTIVNNFNRIHHFKPGMSYSAHIIEHNTEKYDFLRSKKLYRVCCIHGKIKVEESANYNCDKIGDICRFSSFFNLPVTDYYTYVYADSEEDALHIAENKYEQFLKLKKVNN